jgi:flavodoxin
LKKIYFALPTIAAFLLFICGQVKMNFAAQVLSQSNTGKKNNVEALSSSTTKKILVAYFSRSGNTREIANQIQKSVGGDIFEIQPAKPYPGNYDAVLKLAKQELESKYEPVLKTKIENIESYDVIFIGYPNWWSTFPAPVRTFLSQNNFPGKTIIPFCTYGGGGIGQSIKDISTLCPNSTLLDGFAILGKDVKTAQNKVSEWLREIKITK